MPSQRIISIVLYNLTMLRTVFICVIVIAIGLRTLLLHSLHHLSGSSTINNELSKPRILLYLTTHMSLSHFWFLQTCWPLVLQHSALLRESDVMVYLTASEEIEEAAELAVNQLNWTFHNQPQLIIHKMKNPGYQEGAMAAMKDAVQNGWFDGYDWIIRLNPDVIVRDDSFLVHTIYNDTNATAVLIDCIPPGFDRNNLLPIMRPGKWSGPLMQTDFFAIKSSTLKIKSSLFESHKYNAEMSFTTAIRDTVLDKGGHRIFPNVGSLDSICRAGSGRRVDETPVVHFHFDKEMEKNQIQCPIPFK